MAFSQATITHTFENADGTPASGTVTFTLSKRMTNGTVTIVPAAVPVNLDVNGTISKALTANNDTGTDPQDSQWRVDFRIATPDGPLTETFWITVPTGGGSHDLGTLLPTASTGG